MSVKLEQNGLYILAHALEGSSYLILQAVQTSDGWSLIENHATPFGSDEFKARRQFSPDQMVRFAVQSSGELVEQGNGSTVQQMNFTLANLSLIGYLRNGTFVPTEEGL